jgi:4-hydroxybenzoate polyprenyltransferase
MKQAFSILQLLRVHNLCLGAAAVLVAANLLDFPINELVIKTILIVMSTMALGYIMNDFLDIKADMINHPNRPLVKKKISYLVMIIISLFLFLVLFFSSRAINIKALVLLLVYIFPSLLCYNFFLKRSPALGNIIVSVLLASIFLFTELVLINSFNKLFIPFILTALFSVLREMIKDLQDYNGDLSINMRTLPIILGQTKMRYLIIIWIIFLLIILTVPYYFFNYTFQYLILLIIFIEIPLIYSLFLLIKFPSKSTYKNLTKLLKFLCVLGLIVIMSGKN